MLSFFGAIIAVNVAFTIIAVRTFPGEEVRRSYLQGLSYNQTIAERRAEADTGWAAFAELARNGDDAIVRITLTDSTHAPLTHMALEADLRRPAESESDRTLRFTESAPGFYAANVGALATGQWIVRGVARRDGAQRRFERRLTWPAR